MWVPGYICMVGDPAAWAFGGMQRGWVVSWSQMPTDLAPISHSLTHFVITSPSLGAE